MAALDGCFVISLGRRPDRFRDFCDRLPADFPFPRPTRIDAVDGRQCPPPAWWGAGRGAWGCYRSHVLALEKALAAGMDSVAIFEDDATFLEGFSAGAVAFLQSLPADCGQAYLGGQHLLPPAPAGNVMRCRNVNRTHAYAVVGGDKIKSLYQYLHDCNGWPATFHIDHRYGQAHESGRVIAYAPLRWLCGQAAGMSDVCEKAVGNRVWSLPQNIGPPLPFFAVMGLHRSGSSALATMAHKLGLSMGRKLTGYESKNGGGGEAVTLSWICEQFARFPAINRGGMSDDLKSRLRLWIAERCAEDAAAGRRTGGKYPHLCAMGPDLRRICGEGLRVIVCDRPLADSIESLKQRSRANVGRPLFATDKQCEEVQTWLYEQREAFLAELDKANVLRIAYAETLDTPQMVAERLISFANITTDGNTIANAIAHISKQKQTVGV